MIIHNIEQGTDEWHQVRAGVVTASEFATVMAKGKGGGESKTRSQYMRRLAGEIISGQADIEGYSNQYMERGHELEGTARQLYELTMGIDEVQQVGFVTMDSGRIGCSPDGIIFPGGGLEIKTRKMHLQVELLLSGKVPSEHLPQIQGCIWVCETEWWDFMSYHPALPPFIKRVHRDDRYIKNMKDEVEFFIDDLDGMVERLRRLQ